MGASSGLLSVTQTGQTVNILPKITPLSSAFAEFAGNTNATVFTVAAGHRYVIKNISLIGNIGVGGTLGTLKFDGVTILGMRFQSDTASLFQKYDYGDLILTAGKAAVIAGDGYYTCTIQYIDEVV